jgi:hypothetical protein
MAAAAAATTTTTTKYAGMFLSCPNLLQLIIVIKHRNMWGSLITPPFGVPDNNLT